MLTPEKGKDSDWAYLPAHLLESVLNQLRFASDYVRFSVVCEHWLSTAQFHHKQWLKSFPKQLPMLLHNSESMKHALYSVAGENLVLTKANLHIPNTKNVRCCGSSHGWLMFIQYDTFALILFNPFTRATIHLPPIIKFSTEEEAHPVLFTIWEMNSYTIDRIKVVLSEDPSLHPDTYQVLVIHNLKFICLFRSGSDSWNHVLRPLPLLTHVASTAFPDDAIYYQGKFYITGKGWLMTVESGSSSPPRAVFRRLQFGEYSYNSPWHSDQHYLAESCNGCLLYIQRTYRAMNDTSDYLITSGFRVYKVNLNHDGPQIPCAELQCLDGETLFLGFSRTISVLASEFSSCRPECIYYIDQIWYRYPHFGTGIGVYDYARRQRARRHRPGVCRMSLRDVIPPIWIVPQANLCTIDTLVAG